MIKIICLFEISLLIIGGIAFAYLMSETNNLEYLSTKDESRFVKFVRKNVLEFLSKGLVSAQSVSLQTCFVDRSGAYCQEYPSEICNSRCDGQCFPGRRNEFSQCQMGTCYDTSLGTCGSGTPRSLCESNKGVWYESQPVQCNRGCCLISPDNSGGASQARFTTSQECNYLSQTVGAQTLWNSQITNEVQCLSTARTQREGACVLEFLPDLNKYNCEFITETRCLSSGGTFYDNQLCTNPELDTKCEITQNTGCFENKDGVYFVDSCGNPANIYDSSKLNTLTYWSSVVPLSQSCSLGTGSNSLANQQRCGNCDYIFGNTCGSPQPNVDKSPIYGNYVCKDLSCLDKNGKVRQHGESWCVFDGRIGLDGSNRSNEERAVDVPGSRHYRELCYEGEVRLEPCAEYRNGICVENDVREGFTNAQCRVNTGSLCIRYNENEESLQECSKSPDCFLKHVKLDKFEFDVCASKYPVGFEISDEPNSAEQTICSVATQTCTYYEKKGIDGKWSCKVNCECKDAKFAETMNNLCMSLGDCGSHVNLAGEIGKGYSTSGNKKPKISDSYINGLKKYITPVPNQRVSGFAQENIASMLNLDFNLEANEIAGKLSQFGLGVAGLISFTGVGAPLATGFSAGNIGLPLSSHTFLSGLATGVASVGVGAGVGYIIGTIFGLEGDALTAAVVIGAVAGVAYGMHLIYAAQTLNPVIIIIVVVITLILNILGIGKYRERKVEFSCLPWQPPSGGDNCAKCGELGIECTSYKCKSLGKTCELLNPETENEACVNIAPDDASAPEIRFNSTSLASGFSYEEFQNGVKIKNNSNSDGCIQEYSAIAFGILLNEPGQCKISSTRPENGYDEMEDTFFDSSGNAYTLNHRENTAIQDLDTLGISGSDPERRGNYDLYVLCQDKSGNSIDSSYNLRFCVSPANDLQPPQITKFVPESPGLAGLNSQSFNLQLYTNEPSTCRFSYSDVNYESMENEAICENDIEQSTIHGWLCRTVLNVTGDENNYYFRCADQPWLGTDYTSNSLTLSEGRNPASESRIFIVRRTTNPLTISSIIPDDENIVSGIEPVSVNLEISTSGGIENGKASCKYSFNGEDYIDFRHTSLSNHRQTFTSLFGGNYDIRLKCTDKAGNIAEGNSRFTISVDNNGPIITRAYNAGNNMAIITNEDSVCESSTSSCSFEFGTQNRLNGATKIHTMQYGAGLNYFVKCRDTLENIGSCLSLTGGY
ncbi:MAG: glycine zipper family protein [Nanoarchaeota archaeon]